MGCAHCANHHFHKKHQVGALHLQRQRVETWVLTTQLFHVLWNMWKTCYQDTMLLCLQERPSVLNSTVLGRGGGRQRGKKNRRWLRKMLFLDSTPKCVRNTQLAELQYSRDVHICNSPAWGTMCGNCTEILRTDFEKKKKRNIPPVTFTQWNCKVQVF